MTNLRKINKKTDKRRILIAPLDWGLGHATRCIPIIKLLIAHGTEVIIAAGENAASLLEKEFPNLVILRLKGYKISYSSNRSFFFLKMMMQVPKVIWAIKHEKKWLNHIITEYEIDAVVSDNRFGLYTNKVPCVFITHQLCIQAGSRSLNRLAQKINYRYINKFDECWIPDLAGRDNLAGELSHPKTLPSIPIKYVGILTRCIRAELKKELDLLIIISGPEPQRGIFEKILLEQLKDTKDRTIILRGLPAEQIELKHENKHVSILNHLPAHELNELIQRAKLVVARCGYSTIMDLAALKQKAILIPTPGQTEQEYLAGYLKVKKIFFTVKQESFSLKNELENVKRFEFADLNISSVMNETVITEWFDSLNRRVKQR